MLSYLVKPITEVKLTIYIYIFKHIFKVDAIGIYMDQRTGISEYIEKLKSILECLKDVLKRMDI